PAARAASVARENRAGQVARAVLGKLAEPVAQAEVVVPENLAALVAQAELGAQAELAALVAQASLVVLAAQAVPAGLVVPSPRGVGARGLITLRIEAAPPTPTSGPRTSSVVKPGHNRLSAVLGPATGPAATVKDRAEPGPATGPPLAVRDSAAAPVVATGCLMQAAVAAGIR
ncbi:MAG: hypothetical protein ACJ8AM_11335, partial [Gemmatimonadales bacterium]